MCQSYYAEVVFCHLPVSTFNSVCLHPAAEEASDLVVAMATVLLVFKRRSSEDGRTRSRVAVGRSVVFVVAVSLFHVIVLSSPPLLLFASPPPTCGIVRTARSCIFSFIFGSRQSRQSEGRSGDEESRNPLCGPSEKCP